ncbi:Uma2 family endonuclease [Streptomyces sp. JJ38]|uniref:Uma2 family endonuclease n=1 Tax=Streptomyces sp. JJ38 TaxID=2738128 RepID=UPI001C55A6AF|nr:Uma2 family endonuclease [Streptomyces sp. JJ38]MBW1599052.1 Uma2 family endonuclease [Streptomyces sp. JJ38]
MTEHPTTTTPSTPGDFEDLLRTVAELDVPEGFKAEIIKGKIVVSPWSLLRYALPMDNLREQLAPRAPTGHRAMTAPFLFRFSSAKRAFGPDLYVVDEEAFRAPGNVAMGAALSLVAELTSPSTREDDWQDKLETYGRQVPVYLLVDMQEEELTVFWDPSGRGYRSRTTVPFGEPVTVPEPFGLELDTTAFAQAVSEG